MKPLFIYHDSCMDGFASMCIARMKFGEDAEYFPCNYNAYNFVIGSGGEHEGDTWKEVVLHYKDRQVELAGKTVYVLDFSFKRGELNTITMVANDVIVLDHHKTAREELMEFTQNDHNDGWIKHSELADNITVHFDMEKAGCWLTWDYFMGTPHPLPVYRIGLRDIWKHKGTDQEQTCEAFNLYLGTIGWDAEKWIHLFNDPNFAVRALAQGLAIYDFFMAKVKEIASHAMDRMWGEYTVKIVNCPYFMASEVGSILSKQANIACMWSLFNDGSITMSLRSSDGTDVSAYAKHFGGGGHAAASGFKLNSIGELDGFLYP